MSSQPDSSPSVSSGCHEERFWFEENLEENEQEFCRAVRENNGRFCWRMQHCHTRRLHWSVGGSVPVLLTAREKPLVSHFSSTTFGRISLSWDIYLTMCLWFAWTLSDACHVLLWHRDGGRLWLAQTGSLRSCCRVHHASLGADIMCGLRRRGWHAARQWNSSVTQPFRSNKTSFRSLCYTCSYLH